MVASSVMPKAEMMADTMGVPPAEKTACYSVEVMDGFLVASMGMMMDKLMVALKALMSAACLVAMRVVQKAVKKAA